MDDDILAIGLINVILGVLALTVGHLYTLPRGHSAATISAPFAIALGEE